MCILARTFLQLYELSFCGTTKTRNKYHFKEPHHGIKEPLAGTTSKNPVVVPQRPVTSTTSKNPITVPKNPLQVPLQRTPSWYHKDSLASTTSENPIAVPKNPLQVPLQRTPWRCHKYPVASTSSKNPIAVPKEPLCRYHFFNKHRSTKSTPCRYHFEEARRGTTKALEQVPLQRTPSRYQKNPLQETLGTNNYQKHSTRSIIS